MSQSPIQPIPDDYPEDAPLNALQSVAVEVDDQPGSGVLYRMGLGSNARYKADEADTDEKAANTTTSTSSAALPIKIEFVPRPARLIAIVVAISAVVALIISGLGLALSELAPVQTRHVSVRLQVDSAVEYRYQFRPSEVANVIHPVTSTLVLSATASTTGKREEAGSAARGPVRFLNASPGAIYLSAGTPIAQIGGVVYKLAGAVNVPAASVAAGRAGTMDGEVVASTAGPAGNVPAGLSSFTLTNGLSVAGIGPVTGGTNRSIATVSQADIDKLRHQLEVKLTDQVKGSITQALSAEARLLDAPKVVGQEYKTSHEVGQDTGTVTLTLTAHLTALFYQPSELVAFVAVSATDTHANVAATRHLAAPEFTGLNKAQGDLILRYSRVVRSQSLVAELEGWEGSRRDGERLLAGVAARAGVKSCIFIPQLLDYEGLIIIDRVEVEPSGDVRKSSYGK